MRRCFATLALLAAGACTPPPPTQAGCACTQLTVTLPARQDMVLGYPAVNDAVRKPCLSDDDRTITCNLDDDTEAQCEERAAAARAALDAQGIGGSTDCFDACGCALL